MDIPNYKSNSDRAREKKEHPNKVEKVIDGGAKVGKRSIVDKVIDSLIPEGVTNFKEYIIYDVIIPNSKRVFLDSINSIFGYEPRNSKDNKREQYVSYGAHYSNDSSRNNRLERITDYENIYYETYRDAERVLDAMYDSLAEYSTVTVAELYEYSGKTTNNYQLKNYGWGSLKNASIVRGRNGMWYIKLPRAMKID